MLNQESKDLIAKSVLCWLASVTRDGCPNVSPKEIFDLFDDETLVIADIASAGSVRNIRENPNVCISMIDIFRQQGLKLTGKARIIAPSDADFAKYAELLIPRTGGKFVIRHVTAVQILGRTRIVAPTYRFHPDTPETRIVADAYRSYGVRPA